MRSNAPRNSGHTRSHGKISGRPLHQSAKPAQRTREVGEPAMRSGAKNSQTSPQNAMVAPTAKFCATAKRRRTAGRRARFSFQPVGIGVKLAAASVTRCKTPAARTPRISGESFIVAGGFRAPLVGEPSRITRSQRAGTAASAGPIKKARHFGRASEVAVLSLTAGPSRPSGSGRTRGRRPGLR